MGAEPKKTIKMSDGRDVTVDISTMTHKEWTSMWFGADNEVVYPILQRFTGLTPDELDAMLHDDYRRIFFAISQLASRPLDDPNSRSASI